MKKVKIMLMSALVVAAVGGALAFKAQTFSRGLFCGPDTGTTCPTERQDLQITTVGADENHKVSGIICSTVQNGACTFVTQE